MTEYQKLFEKRYKKDFTGYAEEMDYLFMFDAPEQYGVEDELLKFLIDNPNATVIETIDYFDEIVPDGTLPDCISEEELLKDD